MKFTGNKQKPPSRLALSVSSRVESREVEGGGLFISKSTAYIHCHGKKYTLSEFG